MAGNELPRSRNWDEEQAIRDNPGAAWLCDVEARTPGDFAVRAVSGYLSDIGGVVVSDLIEHVRNIFIDVFDEDDAAAVFDAVIEKHDREVTAAVLRIAADSIYHKLLTQTFEAPNTFEGGMVEACRLLRDEADRTVDR